MASVRTKAGDVYGGWTVLEALPKRSWCRCSCGLEKFVDNGNLRAKGASPQCRTCSNKKRWARERGECATLDYSLFARLHTVVNNAISRCTNEERPCYENYGGRGIKVHEEWLADKLLFVMYLASLPGHTNPNLDLDRIDNDGNYEPGNLRFVTRYVSMMNRRKFADKFAHDSRGRFTKKARG